MLLFEGKYLEVHKIDDWECVKRKNNRSVGIVAITQDFKLVLVEQFRIPMQKKCIELPAGLIGDVDKKETAEETAKRELLEETGYYAHNLKIAGEFAISPGLSNEMMSLAIATNLEKKGEGGGDEKENIKVLHVNMSSFPSYFASLQKNDQIVDSKVLLGIHFGFEYIHEQIKNGKIDYTDFMKRGGNCQ